MKLKVGDKVRIRKDLEVDKKYGNLELLPGNMARHKGDVCTITDVSPKGNFVVKENLYYWSKEMLEPVNCKLIFRDNATILLKDGKRYVSKCQSGDTYDREKGLLLCLAKANGYTYNDICEMLNNAEYQGEKPDAVKFNGVREVKRPAKVGEYVKVVNSDGHPMNEYKNGDILKIIKIGKGICADLYYYQAKDLKYLCEDEYVVLENYTPYKITLSEFWANKGKKDMEIHCKTDNEADELLKAFDRVGQVWSSGDKYTELNMGGKDVYYTNDNKFSNYIWHDIDDIMVYEFNEVDLSK